MYTFIKITGRILRSGIFDVVILVVLCTGLLYCGWKIFHGETPVDPVQETISGLTEKLKRQNPEAAAELAKMKASHNELALAATMKERYQIDGAAGLERLAQYQKNVSPESMAYDLRIAEMSVNKRFASAEQRTNFIFAHTSAIQPLALAAKRGQKNDIILQTTDQYLQTLEDVSQNEVQWRQVRENPLMVLLLQQVKDQTLLDFYDTEKDWLDDVLYILLTNQYGTEPVDDESLPMPQEILQTIKENQPFFKDAIVSILSTPENEIEDAVLNIYVLFANYGKTLRYCLSQEKIAFSDLLPVVWANQDYCDKHSTDLPEVFAIRLMKIRDEHPNVWEVSKQMPLCLQLYDDVPGLADSLCEKFGSDDIATFLYMKYADSLVPAATAIDKFGDVAIYVLNRYVGSSPFRQSLKDNQLGVRIVPYIIQFEDKGLANIEKNKNWLDKYFDKDGNSKEKEWWTAIPGGGAADVARNWASGYPNEWNELGWAALDVADAALLVASFGSSTAVTTTAKSTVKVGSKQITKEVTLKVAESGVRSTSKGSRAIAKQEIKSLFRRAMATAGRSSLAKTGGRYVIRVTEVTAAPLRVTASKIYSAARSLNAEWRGANPVLKKIVYRSLLTVGITVTLWNRTFPMLHDNFGKIAETIGRNAAILVKEVAKAVPNVLSGFVDEMLKGLAPQSAFGHFAKWGIVSVILLSFVFLLGRRTYQRVRG